jgi:hypothetical protein
MEPTTRKRAKRLLLASAAIATALPTLSGCGGVHGSVAEEAGYDAGMQSGGLVAQDSGYDGPLGRVAPDAGYDGAPQDP